MAIRSPSWSKVNYQNLVLTLSKIQPQCQLSGAIASLPSSLRGLQSAECFRAADVRRRRSEVGVIQDVGEGRFKPEPSALADLKGLRQPRGDGDGSGARQDTDGRIPDSSRALRRWRECIDVPLGAGSQVCGR